MHPLPADDVTLLAGSPEDMLAAISQALDLHENSNPGSHAWYAALQAAGSIARAYHVERRAFDTDESLHGLYLLDLRIRHMLLRSKRVHNLITALEATSTALLLGKTEFNRYCETLSKVAAEAFATSPPLRQD